MSATATLPPGAGLALPVHGHIDRVDPAGAVSGWCAAADPPFAPRRITVLVNEKPAISGVLCNVFRKDLLAAGIGDGHHGFRAEIPPAYIVPGSDATVRLLDEMTELSVGQALLVRWPARPKSLPELEAHIDQITPEGMVVGWCWDRAMPDRRVALNILADGVVVGTTLAGLYRDDLRQAGKGSGHCGFSFFLPWHTIASRGEIALALQDHETGVPVGERQTLHRPQLVTADQRIDALERQLQLLRGELQAAEARATRTENDRAAPELFRLVATFFQELADGRPRSALTSLRARLDDVSERLPLIRCSLPADPQVTLYVLAAGPVERLHACLAALHAAAADTQARLVVLDLATDENGEATLIQAVIRNVTVVRLRPSETLNDIVLATPTPYLGLVPVHVAPGAQWLAALVAELAADASVAIAATDLTELDGAVVSPSLIADREGNLLAPSDESGQARRGVDAFDDLGLLLRTETLRRAGGVDLSYFGLPAQILDLCLRLRRQGHRLHCRTAALAQVTEARTSLLDQTTAQDIERLRATARHLLTVDDASRH